MLELTEHQSIEVPLTPDQAALLGRWETGLGVAVVPVQTGVYQVRPGSIVGVLDTPLLTVLIRPKIRVSRLLWLLSYDPDLMRGGDPFGFEDSRDIEEAVAAAMVRLVDHALRRGVLQGYRVDEDALPTVRGRLRIEDQLRKRLGLFPPAEVRFDDFTEDIDENRLLRAALHRLRALRFRSERVRAGLRRLEAALSAAQLVDYRSDRIPHPAVNRRNRRYGPALALAQLVLRHLSYDMGSGGVVSASFLVDMDTVFERFVHVALSEQLGTGLSRQATRNLADRTESQDERTRVARVPIRIDTMWPGGEGKAAVVVDAKYKDLDAGGAQSPDLYQLLAYVAATDAPGGILVYAGERRYEATHKVHGLNRLLLVRAVDLSSKPEQLLGDVDRIARDAMDLREGRPATVV